MLGEKIEEIRELENINQGLENEKREIILLN
jgi:hypothetical protein